MRKEHGRGITVPHLKRMYVVFAVMSIDVNEKLSRISYTGDGLERMAVSQEGEICNRIKFIQEWAGYFEEVAYHQVI